MKRFLAVSAVVLFLMAVFSGPVVAGNVDTFGVGAKATALGGAYAAYANDPFAIYYNPAGLTQIESATLSAGVHFVKPKLNIYAYEVKSTVLGDLGPVDFNDNSATLVVPSLGFAMPITGKLSAGVAVYVPYGLDIKWNSNASATNLGAYNSYHSWYMREVVTPTLAYKISDCLSLGLGISIGKSKSGVDRLAFAPGTSLNNKNVMTDLEDDVNWSANVGLLYKPLDNLSFGVTYRGRTKTKFEGTTKLLNAQSTITVMTGGGPITVPLNNTEVNASTEIDHPEQIQVGVRFLPIKQVSLEADVVWTHWAIIDGYTVQFDRPFLDAPLLGASNPGRTSEYFARDWNNTTQFRFGAEWQVNDTFTLRGSYFYDPSPIPDETMDLQWPDADKHTFALGVGLNFGNFSIDGVVQYLLVEAKRNIGGESENLNDTYSAGGASPSVSFSADGYMWAWGLTFNYKF
jgi:long-chain fatty acid transport protein